MKLTLLTGAVSLAVAALAISSCSDAPPGTPAANGQPYTMEKQGNLLTVYRTGDQEDRDRLDGLQDLIFYATCSFSNPSRTKTQGEIRSRTKWRNQRLVFVFDRPLGGRQLCQVEFSNRYERVSFYTYFR